MNSLLIYVGVLLLLGWGISHLFPTRSVVQGFGEITLDNRRIITMEWITEGVALVFVGLVVAAVTMIDRTSPISLAVYWLAFLALNGLSAVSLFTGFKIDFLPFRLCPFVFTGSSILIILGAYL